MHETSGKLAAAVRAYYDDVLGNGKVTAEQLALLWDYVDHHIHAPCWDATVAGSFEAELKSLRERAEKRGDLEALRDYIGEALELALDPL